MVKREFDWENGAQLPYHSKIKHEIYTEYLREYVRVRCAYPQQERFRLIVIDGFCGAGIYADGSFGSPILSLKTLNDITTEINIQRRIEGFKTIKFECVLIFNDRDADTVELLKENIAPHIASVKSNNNDMELTACFFKGMFSEKFDEISGLVSSTKITNSLVLLDQYGHSQVEEELLTNVLKLTNSTEVFLTFSIQSLLTFLSPQKIKTIVGDRKGVIFSEILADIDLMMNKREWLAAAELVVFEEFKTLANYVSPFAIHGQAAWQYWFIHFANSYRARQVYNDILHKKKNSQAHVGRSGIMMMRYASFEETCLYLFDAASRENARFDLLNDVPKFVSATKDPILVGDFYSRTYNQTPAHSDDINTALLNSSDIEVFTKKGGKRRKSNLIKNTDIVTLAPQKSFHFMQ